MVAARGTIVAERILNVVGSKAQVRVCIGKPRKERASSDYTCSFSIEGLGERMVQQAWGIDAIQALQLAMQGIRKVLLPHVKRLRWVGSEAGGLGFPIAIPEVFGVKFSRRIERMVQLETDRFGRALERTHRKAVKRLAESPRETQPGSPRRRSKDKKS